jgi:tRNA/tmRNA/rRNA uracil-C5-methylase (TrmA/RlmC/RlmD family)
MRCGTSVASSPETVFAPLIGPGWGYRYRARLSVRDVPGKGGVRVGFRERRTSHVTDMASLRSAAASRVGDCCGRCAI